MLDVIVKAQIPGPEEVQCQRRQRTLGTLSLRVGEVTIIPRPNNYRTARGFLSKNLVMMTRKQGTYPAYVRVPRIIHYPEKPARQNVWLNPSLWERLSSFCSGLCCRSGVSCRHRLQPRSEWGAHQVYQVSQASPHPQR